MSWDAPKGRYIADLLNGLHAPNTTANRKALAAWAQAEGGTAHFNPFNTTQPGGTRYNSVGVQSYGNYNAGLHATLATLKNGRYGNILNALHNGHNAMGVANAIEASPWGTGGLVKSVLAGMHGVPPAVGGSQQHSPGGHPDQINRPGQTDLVAQIMAKNTSYALTGKVNDPAFMLSAAQNGLTASDQKQMGNKPALQGAALSGKAAGAIHFAKSMLGVPYVWGGTSRQGVDCSGLVQLAYAKQGIHLPRTSQEQAHYGQKVGWKNLRPGDLVFSDFEGTGQATHVVIYIGNGKVIAAPHTGDHVKVEALNLFKSNFVGARRVTH